MTSLDFEAVAALLAQPKKIALIPHRSPDGDAMGATLALCRFLTKTGHDAVVVAPNDFPEFLAWMPGSGQVLVYENDKENVAALLQKQELIFTLDFNALHRTGEMEQVLSKLTAPFVMIDHHEKPDNYALHTYSSTAFGSTCEMIYNFIEGLEQMEVIDQDIATCIYTGILTDSGSFRFPKTTGTTHRIVANLIDLGVDNSRVYSLLFDNNSYNSLQLLGRGLQNLQFFPQWGVSYSTLSAQELSDFDYKKGDTEGIVNYGLSIKGIFFTAIFIEHADEKIIKISFRSQGDFDVNRFAREHFSGGGHLNAAGGKSYLSLADTVRKFERILRETHPSA